MAKRRDEGLPVALATQGGLLAALVVLLVGFARGGREWIVLMQAGMAFLLASGLLKILTAAVIQAIRVKAEETPRPGEEEMENTIRTITAASANAEPRERVAP
jgi:ABC-type Fe3+-siderophore transport system permease subunit